MILHVKHDHSKCSGDPNVLSQKIRLHCTAASHTASNYVALPYSSMCYGLSYCLLCKEVMFLVALVCLSVCLFNCGQHYSKSYERIGMTFYGGVLGSTVQN